MIRFSVFYPDGEGATFDHDYYRDKHVPLAVSTWGLDSAEIDKGVGGPTWPPCTSSSSRPTP